MPLVADDERQEKNGEETQGLFAADEELQRTVCEHPAGNQRELKQWCNELLAIAAAK